MASTPPAHKPPRPVSGSSASSSPSRPSESPTEVLYNTAVQSFVRRDHLKTHASLARLLSALKVDLRKAPRKRWHDLSPSPAASAGSPGALGETAEEWLIKAFKLSISAHASLYTDPPGSPTLHSRSNPRNAHLPADLSSLLPPSPPSRLLQHVHDRCLEAYPDGILPPPILSTLILASLKLQPAHDALGYAHRVTEDWLGALPDAFMEAIARRGAHGKRVEAGREGYLKVLELLTGEVLAREGEWEMARGILDGDTLLGAKRKEALYRHLRASQARREAPQSTSSSGFLPSPADSMVLPDSESPTPTGQKSGRSRASSASSSEATARPASSLPVMSTGASIGSSSTIIPRAPRRKGKARETETTDSESTLPSRIFINQPGSHARRPDGDSPDRGEHVRGYLMRYLGPMVGCLPASLRNRIWGMDNYQLASFALPLPLFGLLFLFAAIRRRQQRNRGAGAAARTGASPLSDVRARLAAARRQGVWAWFVWFLQWWAQKVVGVWRLGTTITYV